MLESVVEGFRKNEYRDKTYHPNLNSFGRLIGHSIGAATYNFFEPIIKSYNYFKK